jgi:hypothetical protein
MKKCFFFIILLSLTGQIKAQIPLSAGGKTPFNQRLYFGGNLGLQFGSVTYIDLSPLAGYMITNNFSAGVGITYRYLKYNNGIQYQTNIYGGRLFARHNLTFLPAPLFVYGEYENLNVELAKYNATHTDYYMTREWIPSLFLGGGLHQSFGKRGGFILTVMYNVIFDSERTIYLYNSPWVIRVGFTL